MANLSRPKRWAAAIAKAQQQLERVEEAQSELNDAMSDLRALQDEYQDWHTNMPDSLQSSTLAEKLEAICNLDLEDVEIDVSEIDDKLREAEEAELPQGFGRD